MRIEFSSLAGLQRITHKRERFEAVYTGAGRLPDVYRAGTNERAQLPAAVLAELMRRFDEVHAQDSHTQELYLMEAKPCSI
jgi:hypothetical protein